VTSEAVDKALALKTRGGNGARIARRLTGAGPTSLAFMGEKIMNEDRIIASNLAAAILQAEPYLAKAKNHAEAAAQLYFECFDALTAEAKKRPSGSQPAFGSYGL
jgi:hypothetical protein